MIKIICDQQTISTEAGKSIAQLIATNEDAHTIYAGLFNGKLHDLRYQLNEDGNLILIKANSTTGKQIYERTLNFVFVAAVKSVFKDAQVHMQHALGKGQFCKIDANRKLTKQDIKKIKHAMDTFIKNKELIHRYVQSTQRAIDFFKTHQLPEKADLLAQRQSKLSSIYRISDFVEYFYGIMLPDASYINEFILELYKDGIWIGSSEPFIEQPKLFSVYQSFEAWGKLMQVSNVTQLNEQIAKGNMNNLVLMSETKVESSLIELARGIMQQDKQLKIILISGPSSAGKTTFSKRLALHLQIYGKRSITLSMDNFYKNREDSPRLADGTFDFEGLDALDLELFQECILNLIAHKKIRLPIFNFLSGIREWETVETQVRENDILIIEGIHGLNSQVSQLFPKESVFKIYINALTHLNIDEHNRIPTSDYRLIRRIARDFQSRSWSASQTIHFWKNVKESEDRNIYPYQENADAIFNSSMVYELSILKKIVQPLLEKIKPGEREYLEANRLNKLLVYFKEGIADAIPRHSILAEFLGNSIFNIS